MNRAHASIAGRLAAASAVLIALAMIVAGTGIVFTLRHFVQSQVDQRLDAQMASIVGSLRIVDGRIATAKWLDGPPFDRRQSGWYWQVSDGKQTVGSASLAGETLDIPHWTPGWTDFLGMRPGSIDGTGPGGRGLHFRVQNSVVGGVPLSLAATAPAEALTGPLWQAVVPVGATILALGLALLAISVLQVRLGLRPLATLRRDIAAIRSGEASRLPETQPVELAPLVSELNRLVAQNAEGLQRARGHAANLGHALNTPLASLALSLAEDASDAAGERRNLVERMRESIRHHLARARAAAEGRAGASTADIGAQIADIVSALKKIHSERPVAIDVRVTAGLRVACEPQDVDEMLGNLLDNAFKWASSRVSVEAAPRPHFLDVIITDDGPGLDDEALMLALQPGRRLDESVPGNGFGLSITRELAELYGGELTLTRASAGGLSARMALPLAK